MGQKKYISMPKYNQLIPIQRMKKTKKICAQKQCYAIFSKLITENAFQEIAIFFFSRYYTRIYLLTQ